MTTPLVRDGIPGLRLNPETHRVPWETFVDGVRFLAARALGDAAAADDIAQEAVLRAIAASTDPRRDAIDDPAAFMHGIARHLIADAQRERAGRPHLAIEETTPSEHPDALTALISTEVRQRLKNAITTLPRTDRHLLELAFVKGLKSPEIANALGETPEAIRKRKSRLVETLRNLLNGS